MPVSDGLLESQPVKVLRDSGCSAVVVRLNNFRASGSILTGLFSVDAPRSTGDKLGTIITMPAPKI